MDTAYDWITVGIFAGLVVVFLQRSVGEHHDAVWPYFAAMIACAAINQVGNKAVEDGNLSLHIAAAAGILAIIGFIQYFIQPFSGRGD